MSTGGRQESHVVLVSRTSRLLATDLFSTVAAPDKNMRGAAHMADHLQSSLGILGVFFLFYSFVFFLAFFLVVQQNQFVSSKSREFEFDPDPMTGAAAAATAATRSQRFFFCDTPA